MAQGNEGSMLGDPARWPLDPPEGRRRSHAARPARHEPGGGRRLSLALAAVLVPLVAATATGLVLLWPRRPPPAPGELGGPAQQADATVTATRQQPCSAAGAGGCTQVTVRLTSGPQRGLSVYLELAGDAGTPTLARGDRVVVGYSPASPAAGRYQFLGYQRHIPMLALAGLFAALLLSFGRLKGIRALAGLGVTLAAVLWFVLPAILGGANPILVVLVGCAAAALVAMYVTFGVRLRTTVALLGTLAGLAMVGALAWGFVAVARLSGLTGDAPPLRLGGAQLELRGLLLAGIVLGTLGVLTDVTATQASTVWQLRLANPDWGARSLRRAAARVGRDHIASTVHALVLAYAGASLPLLLFLNQAGRPPTRVLTGELVATEVARALVGGIGLIAAVPLTTLLAVAVASGAAPGGQESNNGSHDLREPA